MLQQDHLVLPRINDIQEEYTLEKNALTSLSSFFLAVIVKNVSLLVCHKFRQRKRLIMSKQRT